MDATPTHFQQVNTVAPELVAVKEAIHHAQKGVLEAQDARGYWCYELEADCTIPSEYILMMHFMNEIDESLQEKITVYLRAHQNEEGGWPLFYKGHSDLSCTVKAYYALKLAGEDPEKPHMQQAKQLILQLGGAARCNVFTRIMLAMFQQIPWRGVPFIPVEIMLFPRWFPFHLSKVSYWSRTVMVPLFILCSLKATARNPNDIHVTELFLTPPEEEKNYFPVRSPLNKLILFLERIGFKLEPFIPNWIRARAIKKAESWIIQRLNGDSGLGAIFPAMVNAYEALDLLGYPREHPHSQLAQTALQKLLVLRDQDAYCQPCVSPIWDTLLAACALLEINNDRIQEPLKKSMNWLVENQLSDQEGDWKNYRPHLKGGGWPFQFKNDFYPDLDDTAFAAYALWRSGNPQYEENIIRAADWIAGMQSTNGGFAAFDADNTSYHLNEIPFADHGALLDPPTSDVSARCLLLFGVLSKDHPQYEKVAASCLEYIREQQEADGSWFGRWGTNYIYGTWSVLLAFEGMELSREDPAMLKAVEWLKNKQRSDGGWGEDNFSYYDTASSGSAEKSTSFQTSWALLGLMAAGEAHSESVKKGIQYLLQHQGSDGLWKDPEFTAPGFPKVFYLKYHGYDKYFPLWALARYKNEIKDKPYLK